MTTPQEHFAKVVPGFMAKLLRDFPQLGVEDAAAIFGNLGHESKGLTDDQEDKPLAGRGGVNWAQWTGPRRRAFEAYCERNKLDPDSDKAAYKYLYLELKGLVGSEQNAIPRTVSAVGLENKVKAFEQSFLRAHPKYKHYASRLAWAERAMDAWRNSSRMLEPDPIDGVGSLPDAPLPPTDVKPVPSKPGAENSAPLWEKLLWPIVFAAVAFAIWFVFIKR
jgi:hypothetical protein